MTSDPADPVAQGDPFAGTAEHYAIYRRPYPKPVVDYMVEQFGFDGHGWLLDVGCGTGQVFGVLAQYFERVVAIDPSAEMLAKAEQLARVRGITNVEFQCARAEDLSSELHPVRAAVFGASFHRTRRVETANLVHRLLELDGVLIALAPSQPWSGSLAWETALRTTVAKWLGPGGPSLSGAPVDGEWHATALAKSAFGSARSVTIHVREVYTLDDLIGYLRSTSFASKLWHGPRAEEFERSLRDQLLAQCPDGRFVKDVEHTIVFARRTR